MRIAALDLLVGARAALELLTMGVASTVLSPVILLTPLRGPAAPVRSIHLLDGLDLDQQMHVVAHDVRAPVHAPARALDGGFEVAATDLSLEHRVRVAVEALALQRHRMRRPEQRQLTLDFGRLVA